VLLQRRKLLDNRAATGVQRFGQNQMERSETFADQEERLKTEKRQAIAGRRVDMNVEEENCYILSFSCY
jgi:hypothetical protein